MTRWTAAGAALVAAIAIACGGPPTARHVVVITLDTTRADRLGCYGYGPADTPNLDAVAAEAAVFDEAVSPVPVTLPSHASIFTGVNPYGHGVRYNATHQVPEEMDTLAERLGRAGFRTGAVVSAFPVAGRFGLAQGFDTYEDLFAGPEGDRRHRKTERRASEAVDLALQWWEANRDQGRSFLWVHFYDPHWDYAPPFPYSARFSDRPYDGEIAYMDHELGRLFEALREWGDWEESLVVIAGDHGEGLYEHRERWHSLLVYETTQRVPLIVKPAGRPRGVRVAEPVALVDILPTVLDLAGVSSDGDFDGISLRDAIRTGEAPPRDIYFEAVGGSLHYGWSPLIGVRSGPFKYSEGARPELYDLAADPQELVDLSGTDVALEADLASILQAFRDEADRQGETGATRVMDEEALAELASLGYVGSPSVGPLTTGEGPHPPDMVELEQELLLAQTAIGAGNWEIATERLDFLLRSDPTNRFALYFRCRAHLNAGEPEQALTVAEALARIYPESAESSDILGETLSRLGRPGDAATVYAEALKLHPDDPRLRYHHVLALMEAGRIGEAEIAVRALEERRPDHHTAAVSRAMVEAARHNAADALEALERAVDLGLKDLRPVESSDLFESVRALPGYGELKRRAEAPADAS